MSEYLCSPPSQRGRPDPSPITPARRRPQQGTEGDLTLAEREEKFLTMRRRPQPGTSTSSNTAVVTIMTSAKRQVRPRLHLQFIGGNKENSRFINSFRRLRLFNIVRHIPCLCLLSKLQLCSCYFNDQFHCASLCALL